ncbi:hypothetical protein J3R30DRAFT_3287655 [Lentinula aciculospora]|uniref:Uncharacterized protein n=1 Tax=Lentinula aciculospora TaxID=153920 RepID=A0A9W9AFL8_9AGAR|nr:hypothetical protein J3R30DRAFT_3287655 [Lentinula aciculospora]
MLISPASSLWALSLASSWVYNGVSAQTWCGKNYMITEPVTDPGGQFPISLTFAEPHLALRCGPAVKPYLPEDVDSHLTDPTFTSILLDTPVTFTNISGATVLSNASNSTSLSNLSLDVKVLLDGKTLTSGSVPLNTSKHTLPFSLSTLTPRTDAYNVTCIGLLPTGEQVLGSSLLTFLPEKPDGIGGVTKMDMRSGALLAKPPTGEDGPYEGIFPIGFYTQYGSYLATNLSISGVLKEQGCVHPVPDFDNVTVLDEVLDKMQEAGLWLMYDMRNTYQNSTSVTEQVNHIKSRPNLLLWYTADEPDGTSDPLNATALTKNLINTLDGGDGQGGAGYHPVSLVLNCENYFWSEYSNGADILLQDTYMIGNNVTFSNQWGTACTVDYGDCGCDNCKGSFADISTRMDEFYERAFIEGWELEKVVWTVPQGFGNDTYWTRFPTGEEWVVQSIVGINHGGLGVVSWDDPTPDDIKASASSLAKALTSGSSPLAAFILDPFTTFRQVTTQTGIDIGLWTLDGTTLMLAANMNYENATIEAAELGLGKGNDGFGGGLKKVFCSGVCDASDLKKSVIVLGSVSSGAFILA